jgi:hypothetical protein
MGEWAKRLIDDRGARDEDELEVTEGAPDVTTEEGLLAMDMSLSMRAHSLEQ